MITLSDKTIEKIILIVLISATTWIMATCIQVSVDPTLSVKNNVYNFLSTNSKGEDSHETN